MSSALVGPGHHRRDHPAARDAVVELQPVGDDLVGPELAGERDHEEVERAGADHHLVPEVLAAADEVPRAGVDRRAQHLVDGFVGEGVQAVFAHATEEHVQRPR
jgi:hypothetical protein